MELSDKVLLVGAGLGALYLLSRNSSNSAGAPASSPIQTAAVAAGNAIGTAIPQITFGVVEGAANGFKTSAYQSGVNIGVGVNQALTPQLAKTYTGSGLSASVYALPPAQQEPIWDAAYAQKTDIFTQMSNLTPWDLNMQMLKGASQTWNKLLTGW